MADKDLGGDEALRDIRRLLMVLLIKLGATSEELGAALGRTRARSERHCR